MAQASSTDFRRASEPQLLDAIRSGEPLALAEAYHRAVPAAHAVARRLMPESTEVEDVLLSVFSTLWTSAPDGIPLEGWIRRTTWAAAAERLRASGTAPASPSASGLLPDLPAPDVRFIDAAERAIAELPDDQRRALLLAHDKGVATTAQDGGADQALVEALLTLAGPESSSGDRQALDADGCSELKGLGDWCLGIADLATARAVEEAIEERGGCAARSRAVRRGRRRIEGLPATPDMGQRVLVTVLTSSGRVPTPAAAEPAAPEVVQDAPAAPIPDEVRATPTPADDPFAPPVAPADPDDPFADLDDPLDTPPVPEAGADVPSQPAQDAATPDEGVLTGADADVVSDTADLPEMEPAAAPAPAATGDWTPQPGDTAELRLSDILAEGADDDPFAALEADDEPAAPSPAATTNPYAALSSLDEAGAAEQAQGPFAAGVPAADPYPAYADDDAEVYVEGQHHEELDVPVAASRGGVAALLAWILPILGGLAVGILLAVQVFGPPSTG